MRGRKNLRPNLVWIAAAVVLSASLGAESSQAFWGKGGDREVKAKVMVCGFPTEEAGLWAKFLGENAVDHRFDPATRTLYVFEDPIPLLNKAGQSKGLEGTVYRSLLERKLENEIAKRWDRLDDPRVCIAFPSEEFRQGEDDEPIAILYAGGLSRESIRTVKQVISDGVEGLPAANVMVLGSRPKLKQKFVPGRERIYLVDSSEKTKERAR